MFSTLCALLKRFILGHFEQQLFDIVIQIYEIG